MPRRIQNNLSRDIFRGKVVVFVDKIQGDFLYSDKSLNVVKIERKELNSSNQKQIKGVFGRIEVVQYELLGLESVKTVKKSLKSAQTRFCKLFEIFYNIF